MNKDKGIAIDQIQVMQSPASNWSYEEDQEEEEGRVSCTSGSTDGFSSLETINPVSLICELQQDCTSSDNDERSPLGWPLARQTRSHLRLSPANDNSMDSSTDFGIGAALVMPSSSSPTSAQSNSNEVWWNSAQRGKAQKSKTSSEAELMKERFSKLLLGEDMSGGGKGVCTALAISNALTNLSASVFGELWRLEPLSLERKEMWKREMEWLLSVCDYIVEFVPSFHNISDGNSLEVMVSRPRSDLYINLPALRKLDAMLLEALDSFKETEFWYVDAPKQQQQPQKESVAKRQEDKWWLPVPKIPTGGLSETSRKALQNQRDCTSQILKAAMAINEQVLSEMLVPEVYWDSLPKSARANLGEALYYGLKQEQFSPDALLSSLDLSTEHSALEVANRVQSAIHIWRKKEEVPSCKNSYWPSLRLVAECGDKSPQLLIERADNLLLCLRQKFPGLPQSGLDVTKIQYNKDVGQAVLESYSRVLESLAFSILSRIDDVLYIADMTKRNQQSSSGRTTTTTTSRSVPHSFPSRISSFASTSTSPCLLSPSVQSPDGGNRKQLPSSTSSTPSTAMAACPASLLASLCSSVEPDSLLNTTKPESLQKFRKQKEQFQQSRNLERGKKASAAD